MNGASFDETEMQHYCVYSCCVRFQATLKIMAAYVA